MSSSEGDSRVDPPAASAPQIAGATEPPLVGKPKRAKSLQTTLFEKQTEELQDLRKRSDAELHFWRMKYDQCNKELMNLNADNAALNATKEYQTRELRANGLSLVLAGTMAVMGSALLSYVSSDVAKLAALLIAAAGSFWGLAHGIVQFVKTEDDRKVTRAVAIVFFVTILVLLGIHWREIAALARAPNMKEGIDADGVLEGRIFLSATILVPPGIRDSNR